MPPVEPLIYRLYEIVQNYGYAYKAVLNEKFGDGIMSAIAFSTKVEKETDEQGNNWAVITLRGKWYVCAFIPACRPLANLRLGFHSPDFKRSSPHIPHGGLYIAIFGIIESSLPRTSPYPK